MAESVSIIIPSYNSKLWVCNAVESCLSQSHRDCEIIVVDDGSTDNTRELLSQQYGKKIHYIYQENRGLAGARNTGLKHATGKYIQFLDADDLIHPDKIHFQVQLMEGMPSPSVTYTDYYHCDIDDLNHLVPERYLSPEIDASSSPLEEIARRWETRLSIPVHCFLFDARIFRDYGVKFDETLPNHEDWDCWMQVFALTPSLRFLAEKMAVYRVRLDGMCYNRARMRSGFLQAINKQKQLLAGNPIVSQLLMEKEKEIRYLYRDVGCCGRMLKHTPRQVRKVFAHIIPWRIQRMFD